MHDNLCHLSDTDISYGPWTILLIAETGPDRPVRVHLITSFRDPWNPPFREALIREII